MWKLFMFTLIYRTTVHGSLNIESRIVDGIDAEKGEYLFTISLRQNGGHICGGSILNKRYILTAAHCLCNMDGKPLSSKEFSIHYGSLLLSKKRNHLIRISKIICYDFIVGGSNVLNDVSIGKLATDLADDGTWKPVQLADSFDTSQSSTGVVVGWGLTKPNGKYAKILQKLEVDIYNNTICGVRYDTRQQICTGVRVGGACSGDSGSALMSSDNKQIGIASFVTATCGISNTTVPNVFSRVDYFYPWIQKQSKI